jgi:hypothetical protein
LAACSSAADVAGRALSTKNYDARLVGELEPAGGTACDQPMPATLVLRFKDHAAAFTPNDGTLILRGAVNEDGEVRAALNTAPPTKPPYLLTLEGRLNGDAFNGLYRTPLCTYKADLVSPTPLPHHYYEKRNPLGLGSGG